MKINISASNIDLTPNIRDYIEDKIGGLEHYSSVFKKNAHKKKGGPPTIEAWVTIKKAKAYHHVEKGRSKPERAEEGGKFKVEVEFLPPGERIVADGFSDDLYQAVNNVRDKLQREFKQYGRKKDTLARKGARLVKKIRNYSSQLFRRDKEE